MVDVISSAWFLSYGQQEVIPVIQNGKKRIKINLKKMSPLLSRRVHGHYFQVLFIMKTSI